MKHYTYKFFLVLFILSSCSRNPIKDPSLSMELTDQAPIIENIDLGPFLTSIKRSIKLIQKDPRFNTFNFGKKTYTKLEYVAYLKNIYLYAKSNPREKTLKYIEENSAFYAAYGREDYSHGEIFLTSYYQPLIKGSFRPTSKYSRAIYRRPKDLVEIEIGKFNKEDFLIDNNGRSIVSGRLNKKNGLVHISPYYSRSEIDSKPSMIDKKLIIAYLDPIENFLLQIQGSGSIELPSKKIMRVGYDGQNGHKYHPIGKELLSIIPIEELNLKTIENHLRSISDEERDKILFTNPSYVFFKKLDSRPITKMGTEVVNQRTIAVDFSYFPMGALALLEFDRPLEVSDDGVVNKRAMERRLVLAHDTGGAIKGTGRVDLFWGLGKEAKRYAGVIKDKAKLYFLGPKN